MRFLRAWSADGAGQARAWEILTPLAAAWLAAAALYIAQPDSSARASESASPSAAIDVASAQLS